MKIVFDDDAFDSEATEIEDVLLSEEVERKYAGYAYHTIEDRALVNVVDGLKPVQRRILFSMYNSGFTPKKPHTKSARVVGNIMGNYHPHGDASIYDALVRLVQTHTYNIPYIDGQGNFGAPGIDPASPRYTECRLDPLGMYLTSELQQNVAPMVPNYDETLEEPTALPTQIPSLLINGTSGIAVAMASSVPPHNPLESINACIYLLDNQELYSAIREAEDEEQKTQAISDAVDQLTKVIPAPDFPTGGEIVGVEGAVEGYKKGDTGKIVIRAKYRIDAAEAGKSKIIFYELPYGTSALGVQKTLREAEEKYVISQRAVKENNGRGKLEGFQIDGILSAEDFADAENPSQLVVEVDAKTNPRVVAAELLKKTALETTFNFNVNCLVNDTPKVISLPEMIQHFLNFRRGIVTKRAERDKEKAENRIHTLDGLLKVLIDIDTAIKIIRESEDQDEANTKLKDHFSLDDEQAKAVLNIALRRLTKLDSLEINEERDTLDQKVQRSKEITTDKALRDSIVREEFVAIAEDFAKDERFARKTSIQDDVSLAEYMANQKSLLTQSREVEDEDITLSLDTNHKVYRSQKRHAITQIETTTLSNVILFTNSGQGIRTKVRDITSGYTPKELAPDEYVVGIGEEETDTPMILGTEKGVVYAFQAKYPTRSDKFQVISLTGEDSVLRVQPLIDPESEVVFISDDSNLLRFPANLVTVKASITGKGIVGMKPAEGAKVLEFAILSQQEQKLAQVATATDNTVKLTVLSEFPQKGRGTRGVKSHRFIKGDDALKLALVGAKPEFLNDGEAIPVEELSKRDGGGMKSTATEIRRVLIPVRKPEE